MKENKPKSGRLYAAVSLVLLCVFAFAVFRITATLRERSSSRQVHDGLAALAVETLPPETVPPLPAEEPEQVSETGEPVPPVPIRVDFSLLRQENEDIAAWLYCPDTPINYPVVQGRDNTYYLEHMPNGQWNRSGSIFLDFRCDPSLGDSYSLIHGHNLQDTAMFGSLPQYADQAYYEAHRRLYLLTPDKSYVVELFAGFVTDSDDRLYTVDMTQQRRQTLVEDWIARSDFSAALRPKEEDRLIALSTCSYAYDDARYVVIGILRESETETHRK